MTKDSSRETADLIRIIRRTTGQMLRHLGPRELDSFLFERSALAYGLKTTRFHTRGLYAEEKKGGSTVAGFHEGGTMLSSRASLAITQNVRRL